ncbi:hypothetical protein [uncultured Thiodictyon sp.]|jgi:hypothetical protein|uniref:hypothetical protein n=1 Tax=uncultured Thiodictyon sp. TaxID=1846217 RepID=UPI0025D8EDF3|nr:hypothetical protein [uncultured Thiodictyon sp.]
MRSLGDLISECDLHLLALQEAMARCPRPLTVDHFATRDPALIAALDQFAYRFVKLQDVISVQLFRRFALDVLHEPVESLPVIDILNLLERYRYLPSVSRWQEIREMRNQITHEYRLDPGELIMTLEIAFRMVSEISEILDGLNERRRRSCGSYSR